MTVTLPLKFQWSFHCGGVLQGYWGDVPPSAEDVRGAIDALKLLLKQAKQREAEAEAALALPPPPEGGPQP